MKRVLKELKQDVNYPVRIYCNNILAIKMAENPVQHDKSKHVEIDRHFIREKIEE